MPHCNTNPACFRPVFSGKLLRRGGVTLQISLFLKSGALLCSMKACRRKPPPGSPEGGLLNASSPRSSSEVAVLDQIRLLRLVARLELEQARGGATENVVLGLVGQERQVVDRRRQIEVP